MVRKILKRPQLQKVVSIPAPIGGLNARDALSAMPPTDAYGLVNWIPQNYGLQNRKGYAEWAIGMGGIAVKSILSWFGASTTIPTTTSFQLAPTTLPGKVFACTDANVYDISAATSTPAVAVALSGTLNAGVMSSVDFTNTAGSWLLTVSEVDGYFTYDGTTWVKVTLGAGATQVSGTDPTTFRAVALWKRRPFFVIANSTKIAYLATDSIYGAASTIDLGPLLKHGGSIAWIANWTIDAGEGIDDLLVIASENGDIIVYKGSDPASSATFALVGVWYVGEIPKGRKCFTNFGGDLLIVSNLGITPMSYITRGGGNVLSVGNGNYTEKIQQLFGNDISTTFNFYGWEILQIPRENMMLITVPSTAVGVYTQYVMNLTNNQWCQFSGMPMQCVKSVANWPLFGTSDGRVCIAFTQYLDNVKLDGTVGVSVAGYIQPAFSYFNKEADIYQNKHFLMVRPVWLSTAQPGVLLLLNTDFQANVPVGSPVSGTVSGAMWDVSKWGVAIWPGLNSVYKNWLSVTGVGFAGQISMLTSVNVQTLLVSVDYMLEAGGPM